jgi:putative membrane protein
VHLSENEAGALQTRIAGVERRVGIQIATTVVGKCDAYVELPWKAFALGVAFAGFAIVIVDLLRPDWVTSGMALVHVVLILGVGAASALVAVFVPAYARLFLRSARREVETYNYAQSVFLRRELFRTHGRDAILILISRFERSVSILPDVGLHTRVSKPEWDAVIARMLPSLAAQQCADALAHGLDAIEQMLLAKGFRGHTSGSNEIPDRPTEEDGRR